MSVLELFCDVDDRTPVPALAKRLRGRLFGSSSLRPKTSSCARSNARSICSMGSWQRPVRSPMRNYEPPSLLRWIALRNRKHLRRKPLTSDYPLCILSGKTAERRHRELWVAKHRSSNLVIQQTTHFSPRMAYSAVRKTQNWVFADEACFLIFCCS